MPLKWKRGTTRSSPPSWASLEEPPRVKAVSAVVATALQSRRRAALGAAAPTIQLQGVGHFVERCDVIDMLEESARLHRPLVVELKDGRRFTDEARDVITEPSGDEWAVFRFHDRLSLDEISSCRAASPLEPTYRGKIAR